MNYLEIKHLRMICAIAETGNMTKAAEKLFISQSAISQQLKDIENKLMADLFFRTSKKMILTSTGKKLLKTARRVVEQLEEAELDIEKTVSGDRGELKVGTQCVFCYQWLPRVMGQFQIKYPNIEFEIGNSDNPLEELESKKFDFIITGAPADEDGFTYLPLFEDDLVCIMGVDHPYTAQPFIHFEDLGRENLISHGEKRKNKFYQRILKPMGIEPRRFMAVGESHAIIELVASGFGISVFPWWAVKSAIESNHVVARPITKNGLPLTWHAVFLKNSAITVFQKEFIHLVSKMNPTGGPGLAGAGNRPKIANGIHA